MFFKVKMTAERSTVSWTVSIWSINSDSLILRNEEWNQLCGEQCPSHWRQYMSWAMSEREQKDTASTFRCLSGLWQLFHAQSSEEWLRKTFTSAHPFQTSLSLCFVHQGPFLVFTTSSQGEGGNKKSVFMGTSLWNVTAFKNYLRFQVKYIWILNYLWNGREKPLLEYLSRKANNNAFKKYISNGQATSISPPPPPSHTHSQDACQCQL